MTLYVRSQSYISLPSFMFVGAAVSELCELNQDKKEKEATPGPSLYIQVNAKWGYRDGVKSKGDKIGMDYTHGAVR